MRILRILFTRISFCKSPKKSFVKENKRSFFFIPKIILKRRKPNKIFRNFLMKRLFFLFGKVLSEISRSQLLIKGFIKKSFGAGLFLEVFFCFQKNQESYNYKKLWSLNLFMFTNLFFCFSWARIFFSISGSSKKIKFSSKR